MDYMYFLFVFFFNDTATTEIYTLSLHDALPILKYLNSLCKIFLIETPICYSIFQKNCYLKQKFHYLYLFIFQNHLTFLIQRSEEYTSELQSRQYLVCRLLLEKKKKKKKYLSTL